MLTELALSCAVSAVAGGRLWWLRKDGDGDSAVLMNWPGRISCERNTASAGENSLSSLNEALMPSITHGRWLCQ